MGSAVYFLVKIYGNFMRRQPFEKQDVPNFRVQLAKLHEGAGLGHVNV